MPTSSTDSAATNAVWRAREEAICRFDRARREGGRPEIAVFLDGTDGDERIHRLVELIKVDMEYGWRGATPALVEEYVARFLELGERKELVEDLFVEELTVRCGAGRLPDNEEIARRYPEPLDRWVTLAQAIQIDIDAAPPRTRSERSATQTARGTADRLLDGERVLGAGAAIGERYTIRERLGKGSFASVWRATDRELNRDVAIKILHAELSVQPIAAERMAREARTVASLDHPAIAPVYEVGQWRDRPFIVSQYVPGLTLEEKLAAENASLNWAASIIRNVARGLQHAHENGVIHRDVKPANILMAKDDTPVLVDFGLAHHLEQGGATITREGDLVGTPAYMAPEQADGQRRLVDARADVYALGVVLYQATTGALPFVGATSSVVHQILFDAPAAPRKKNPAIGRDLETIMQRCMEKEPADRYVSAAALADDLDRLLAGEPINARPVGRLERLWKWSRRYPRIATLLAIAVMLAGFLLGTGWQLRSVQSQRDRARIAEEVANQSKNETQTLLAQSAADAGRLSMQRGKFRDALRHFDRSLKRGFSDLAALRTWRIEALIATRQLDRASDEMQAILELQRDALVDDAFKGVILLWQAELALEGFETRGDAETLFAQALEEKLSHADRAYAVGMLAATTPDAIQAFRAAVHADATHHRARRMFVAMLISMGEWDAAMTEIAAAKPLFPDDEGLRLWEALVLAATDDLAGARRLTASLLDASDAMKWNALCLASHYITRTMKPSIEGRPLNQRALAAFCNVFASTHAPLLASRGFHFPPRIADAFRNLPAGIDAIAANDKSGAIEPIRRFVAAHPISSASLLLGELLLGEDRVDEALDAFLAAARQPTVLHDAHFNARKGIVGASLRLGLIDGRDREKNLGLFLGAARDIPADRVDKVEFCRALTIGALEAHDQALARRWAERWLATSGTNRRDALWHLMIVEQRDENHLEVIALCDEMLKIDADFSVYGSVEGARQAAVNAVHVQIGPAPDANPPSSSPQPAR